MAAFTDTAHRWANKDFGLKGRLTAGNCRCDRDNFYSYNTVVGKWLDKERNVMAILDKADTVSVTKHVHALVMAAPKGVHVFRFSITDNHQPHANVALRMLGGFGPDTRMELVKLFVDRLYSAFKALDKATRLSDGEHMKWWDDIVRLNGLYGNDASPGKFLRSKPDPGWTKKRRGDELAKKRMVRCLMKGGSQEDAFDAACGEGAHAAYMERIKPLLKAKRKRELVRKMNGYLHVPYGGKAYSYKEIKSMPPSRLTEIKFANLARKSDEYWRMKKHRDEAVVRAMRYIGIKMSFGNPHIGEVVSRFTGETVYLRQYSMDYTDKQDLLFGKKDFESFRKSPDKRSWIRKFYRICELKSFRMLGYKTLTSLSRTRKTLESLSETELLAVNSYQARVVKRRQERELYDKRMKEERRADAERREAEERVNARKIEECRQRGLEGLRDIWRDRLAPVPEDMRTNREYYQGGNVLLRVTDDGCVETSKAVRIRADVCGRLWKSVLKWHADPSGFSPCRVRTHCGTYTVSKYGNDVMTCGCHDIAFAEMLNVAVKLGWKTALC